MADNDWSPAASAAGPSIATDDIGNVRFQRVKLIFGADGVNAGDVSSANPFPIDYTKSATVIDTTTTPLGISASYTSPTFDHSTGGSFVTHYIYADVGGTHYFEESHDGTNWIAADAEPVTGGTVLRESHQAIARYSRARYVNGGTAQTTFYHQSVQKHIGQDEYIKISDTQNQITGNKTHNGQSPSTNNLGVLPSIALAAAPSLTEGNQVCPRVTLSGDTPITLDGEAVVLGAGVAEIGKLAAGAANIGDVDVLTIAPGDNNIGNVDIVTMPNSVVAGDVASDGVDSGNPVKIGGIARNTNPTSVANLDRVNGMFDLSGRIINKLGNPRGLFIQNTITLTTTTETTLLAAAVSTFHDLTLIEITNSSATAVVVSIRDTTAGTVRKNIAIAANGGAVISMMHPFEQTTVNTNWTAQLSAAVTSVYINAQAIKNVA